MARIEPRAVLENRFHGPTSEGEEADRNWTGVAAAADPPCIDESFRRTA